MNSDNPTASPLQLQALTRALSALKASSERVLTLPAAGDMPSITLRLLNRAEQDEVDRQYMGVLSSQDVEEDGAFSEAQITLRLETLSRAVIQVDGNPLPPVLPPEATGLKSSVERVTYLRKHLLPALRGEVVLTLFKRYTRFYAESEGRLEEDWKMTDPSDPEEARLYLEEQIREAEAKLNDLRARMERHLSAYPSLAAEAAAPGEDPGLTPGRATQVRNLVMRESVDRVEVQAVQDPAQDPAQDPDQDYEEEGYDQDYEEAAPPSQEPPRPRAPQDPVLAEQDRLYQERLAAGLPMGTSRASSGMNAALVAAGVQEPTAAQSAADRLGRAQPPAHRQPLNAAPIQAVRSGLLPSEGGPAPALPGAPGSEQAPPSNPRFKGPSSKGG